MCLVTSSDLSKRAWANSSCMAFKPMPKIQYFTNSTSIY